MPDFDVDLLADTAEHKITALMRELADLCDSHGVPFATSVMLSACADVAGAALAMAKSDDVRKGGLIMLTMAAKKAMDKYSADYAAGEAIDKARGKV